jgi:hypothetical protein
MTVVLDKIILVVKRNTLKTARMQSGCLQNAEFTSCKKICSPDHWYAVILRWGTLQTNSIQDGLSPKDVCLYHANRINNRYTSAHEIFTDNNVLITSHSVENTGVFQLALSPTTTRSTITRPWPSPLAIAHRAYMPPKTHQRTYLLRPLLHPLWF